MKRMSYVLRHDPDSVGLALDSAGWVDAGDLAAALEMSLDELLSMVESDDKGRYEYRDGRVRASHGHSVPIDLDLKPQTPPRWLFHGTTIDRLLSIQSKGLLPMGRMMVHLSESPSEALIVATRRKGDPILLRVDALGVSQDNLMFRSPNGVWLVQRVPPCFIQMLD